MLYFSCANDNQDLVQPVRRLILVRWLVVATAALLVLALPSLLAIELPRYPLLSIVVLSGGFNALAARHLANTQTVTGAELFSQLCFDLACLSGLVFFSGGATNPLISLLLPPVAIAALTLTPLCAAIIGGLAVVAYSILMVFYIPLPLADAARATQLHLTGMWLTFAASALAIGTAVARLTQLIRVRDAQLAAAREQAIRDERVLALGTLAAGAAHELGTPLATMAIVVGELQRDPDLSTDTQEDLALLKQQIGLCKEMITRLSRRAGAERLESVEPEPAASWLDNVRQHWHCLRPEVSSRLLLQGMGTPPRLLADPTLEQAIHNLLNNAANASDGQNIVLELDWQATQLTLRIRDHGNGFTPAQLAQAGHSPFPAHARGSGIGLILTRSAVERLGGKLTLANHPDGGALVTLTLPALPDSTSELITP